MEPASIPSVELLLRREAIALGRTDGWLRREVKAGRLAHVRHGVYADPAYLALAPADQHRVRAAGIQRYYRDDVALSHVTASLLWGSPDWGLPLDLVHVTQLDEMGERTEAGVRHHRGHYPLEDLTRTSTGWISTPARAVVESLPLLGRDAAVCQLDWLRRRHRVDLEGLQRLIDAQRAWPYVARSRELVALSDGGSDSPGETRSRLLFHDHGIPAPITQYEVRDPSGRIVAVLDFGWPEHRLAGEFDGRQKYVGDDGTADLHALIREKEREDLVRELTGWRFIRLTWSDLARPTATAARVRWSLERAQRSA